MPLRPSFSVSQDSGSPSILRIQDTSTGSDSAITSRKILLLQSDGTYLVPSGTTTNYISWSLTSTTIDLDVLTGDTALQITISWVNSGGTVLYTVTTAFGFPAFGETFYYNLTQLQQATPLIIESTNYYNSKMILRVELDSAAQAISFAGDIYSAQQCFDRANILITNQNYYF